MFRNPPNPGDLGTEIPRSSRPIAYRNYIFAQGGHTEEQLVVSHVRVRTDDQVSAASQRVTIDENFNVCTACIHVCASRPDQRLAKPRYAYTYINVFCGKLILDRRDQQPTQ